MPAASRDFFSRASSAGFKTGSLETEVQSTYSRVQADSLKHTSACTHAAKTEMSSCQSSKRKSKSHDLYWQYNFMIRIRLREEMENYRLRTGVRLTYESISECTSISLPTLQSLASRQGYNTRLSTIEKLCRFLGCPPSALLELVPETEEPSDGC